MLTHTTHTQYKHAEAAEAAVLTRNGYQCYGKKIKVRFVFEELERASVIGFWSVSHPRPTGIKKSTPTDPHTFQPTHTHTQTQKNGTSQHHHLSHTPQQVSVARPASEAIKNTKLYVANLPLVRVCVGFMIKEGCD